jgi:Na+/H+ antiporter NhaC
MGSRSARGGWFSGEREMIMDSPIVLLPVLCILAVAIATKRSLFAMLCGLLVASVILCGSVKAFPGTLFGYLYGAMSNETLQWLILVVALFGILIMLLQRSGAVLEFGVWASHLLKTKRSVMLGTFVLGIIVFIDDYLNNLAVGTTMKGISDAQKIPRTQLAYIVNSVAAPVCILLPMSSWAAYFGGLFEENGIVANGTGIGAYVQSIPFMFYGWIAVIVVFLQILGVIPKIGRIKKDWKRVELTGNVFPESDNSNEINADMEEIEAPSGTGKSNPIYFLAPIVVMIAVTLLTGIDVLYGVAGGVVCAFVLFLAARKLSFKLLLSASFDGVVSMGFVLILSVLAFGVQNANIDLGLADYVIDTVKPLMNGAFLPAVAFIVCAAYAYVTGSFWDMAVIVAPIVISLATAMDVSPILAGAAVFSGAAFGSNTCLYGDGVILCAQACGIKPIELMLATLPYALISAGASTILFLVAGFVM